MDDILRDVLEEIFQQYSNEDAQKRELDAVLYRAGYRRLPEEEAPLCENIYPITLRYKDPRYMDRIVREAFLAGQKAQRDADMKWMRGEK